MLLKLTGSTFAEEVEVTANNNDEDVTESVSLRFPKRIVIGCFQLDELDVPVDMLIRDIGQQFNFTELREHLSKNIDEMIINTLGHFWELCGIEKTEH